MLYFEDVAVGDRTTALDFRPSNVTLFRFSAVTWNAHRIHYDKDYAALEGYPDVLVQSHLHGCFLAQAALSWTQGSGVLRRFRWENRAVAIPGDTLRCEGIVTGRHQREGGTGMIDLELTEVNQTGHLCAPAWATLALPSRTAGNGA